MTKLSWNLTDPDITKPLYDQNGWSNYLIDWNNTKRGIQNSISLIAIEGNEVVGLIRGISDDATILYIQDLLVLPKRQNQGIGTKLLSVFLKRFKNVGQIILTAENTKQAINFYRKNGLTLMPSEYGSSFVKDIR